MAKLKCKCEKSGCAHYGRGNCRLTDQKCVMEPHHYACCPVNEKWGAKYAEVRALGENWDTKKEKHLLLRSFFGPFADQFRIFCAVDIHTVTWSAYMVNQQPKPNNNESLN